MRSTGWLLVGGASFALGAMVCVLALTGLPIAVAAPAPAPAEGRKEESMKAILFVRIKSGLEARELERRLLERRPRFLEVPGLLQKIYGRDPATGDVCGIYFFESQEALAAFRETDLARTIPTAYEAKEIRREAYELLYPLRPDSFPQ